MLSEKSKSQAEIVKEEAASLEHDDLELFDFEKLNSVKAKELREKAWLEIARQNKKRTELLDEADDAITKAFQLLKNESNQRIEQAKLILARLKTLQTSWRDEILTEFSKIQHIENELKLPAEKMMLVKVIGREGTLASKLAHEYYTDYINTLKACHSFFRNLHDAIVVCQNTASNSRTPYYDIEIDTASKLFGVDFDEEPVLNCVFHMLKMQFLINGPQQILFTHFYDMNYRLYILRSLKSDFLGIEVFKALASGNHEDLHKYFPTDAHKALVISYSSRNAFLPPKSSVTTVNKALNDDFTVLRKFYDLLTSINRKIADCNTVLGTTCDLSFTDNSPEAMSKFFGITITHRDAKYVTEKLQQLHKKQGVEEVTEIDRRLLNMEQQCDALLLTLNSEAQMDLPNIQDPHTTFSEKLNDLKKRCNNRATKARL